MRVVCLCVVVVFLWRCPLLVLCLSRRLCSGCVRWRSSVATARRSPLCAVWRVVALWGGVVLCVLSVVWWCGDPCLLHERREVAEGYAEGGGSGGLWWFFALPLCDGCVSRARPVSVHRVEVYVAFGRDVLSAGDRGVVYESVRPVHSNEVVTRVEEWLHGIVEGCGLRAP